MSAMFFASCGGGSKMYQDAEKILKDGKTAVENAKDCDNAKKAAEDMLGKIAKLDPKSYNGDTITTEEASELKKLTEEITKAAEAKCK